MASIQLVQRVFNLLGRSSPESITGDPWGPIINAIADAKTRIVIDEHNWNFAIQFQELSLSSSVNNPIYRYQYNIPLSISRVVEVYQPFTFEERTRTNRPEQYIDYEIISRSLYTNIERILIRYVSRNIDIPSQYQSFVDAIAYFTAAEAALVLLENVKLEERFMQLYDYYMRIARASDVNPGTQRRWWVNRRYY